MCDCLFRKGLVLAIIILFIGMSVFPSTAVNIVEKTSMPTNRGKTLYVGGTGGDNYTEIQDAIDDAFDGDTVFVYDDSSPYYEKVQINNSINLIGEDKDTTVIDAKRKGHVITICSNNVSIHEFTLQNSSGDSHAGIRIDFDFGFSTISDNIIIDNNNGINMFLSGDNNIIEDNTFYNNKQWSIKGTNNYNMISGNTINHPLGTYPFNGIGFDDGIGNNISGNTIKNCDSGINLASSDYNLVLNNEISSNEYDGIRISDSSNNTIIGNNISYNLYWGIEVREGWEGDSNDNLIYHNNLVYNYENAYDQGNNIWDDGEYGNYWSDYKERYPDAKKKWLKGIWDTPYEIPGGSNKDMCPLVKQWPDSKPRTISRNTASYSSYLLMLLEQFPILRHLLLQR